MRDRTTVLAAAMLLAACGGSDGGNQNKNTSQVTLRVTTSGNGLVRGAGPDCRSTCSAQYPAGSQVHLVAVPDSGATFSGWAGACSGTATCDVTLDADADVSAAFPPAGPPPPSGQHRLTVVVQGKGRVTSAPAGIDCDSTTCSANFADGTSITLTAVAPSGGSFSGWGGGCTGPAGCALTLSQDQTVYATFSAPPPPPPAQVHLVASVTGPGTVAGGGLDCGESTFTCDVMVARGSTVTLAAMAAGGTRFGGWGGACSGMTSTCQLTLTSDTKVTADFESEVLVLAPNDGTNVAVIAINSTHLFWQRWTSGSSGIWAVPKDGGEAVKVVGGSASSIVADDSYLYWTDQYNLYSTPVGGGEVAQLASAYPIGKLALDEQGALYWTVGSTVRSGTGTVHRMQGRADAVIASGQNPTGSIAVDADFAYFGDSPGPTGSLRRVPRKGGTVDLLVGCDACAFNAVRVDSQGVYYRDTAGRVYVRNKASGAVTLISSANGSPGYTYNPDVEVNASVVFWNWNGGSSPYGIFRANPDGTGFSAIDSSNDASWYALRVDDTAVYYFHGGAIIRRLK